MDGREPEDNPGRGRFVCVPRDGRAIPFRRRLRSIKDGGSRIRAGSCLKHLVVRYGHVAGTIDRRDAEVVEGAAREPREVHEVALFEGEKGFLSHELTHFNYDDVAQFHAKQRKYAEFDASILFKRGVRPKPQSFVLQPLREFWRRFFSLRGYRDGVHGLHLSLLMAYYTFDQYRRLARMWRTLPGST